MLLCLVMASAAWAQIPPPAKPFERFDGCMLVQNPANDGDSFRVRLPDGAVAGPRQSPGRNFGFLRGLVTVRLGDPTSSLHRNEKSVYHQA